MRIDKKVRYLKKMHYKNLTKMCTNSNAMIKTRAMCPLEYEKLQIGEDYSNDPCSVCRAFIKLRDTKLVSRGYDVLVPINCPCLVLGIVEAMKRTRKAMKDYANTT
jgi:hypothetical protein